MLGPARALKCLSPAVAVVKVSVGSMVSSHSTGAHGTVFQATLDDLTVASPIAMRIAVKCFREKDAFIQECEALTLLQALPDKTGFIRWIGPVDPSSQLPPGYVAAIGFERAQTDLAQLIEHVPRYQDMRLEWGAYAKQLWQSIRTLHEHGLIHGDIKSDNILLVCRDGKKQAVLGDFGSMGMTGSVATVVSTYPLPSGLPVTQRWDEFGFAIILTQLSDRRVAVTDDLLQDRCNRPAQQRCLQKATGILRNTLSHIQPSHHKVLHTLWAPLLQQAIQTMTHECHMMTPVSSPASHDA